MQASTQTQSDGESAPERLAEVAAEKASEVKRSYAHGEDKPLGSHLILVAIYNVLAGAFFVARARSGKGFPERIGAGDLVLAGVATHKISRLLAKDRAPPPLRAPFPEFQEEGGHGEVEEKPRRGGGMRQAIGELLVCPFCL